MNKTTTIHFSNATPEIGASKGASTAGPGVQIWLDARKSESETTSMVSFGICIEAGVLVPPLKPIDFIQTKLSSFEEGSGIIRIELGHLFTFKDKHALWKKLWVVSSAPVNYFSENQPPLIVSKGLGFGINQAGELKALECLPIKECEQWVHWYWHQLVNNEFMLDLSYQRFLEASWVEQEPAVQLLSDLMKGDGRYLATLESRQAWRETIASWVPEEMSDDVHGAVELVFLGMLMLVMQSCQDVAGDVENTQSFSTQMGGE